MKQIIMVAVALFVGVILGGIGPRSDLRLLQTQITELESRECKPEVKAGDIGALFSQRMSRAKDKSDRDRKEHKEEKLGTAAPTAAPDSAEAKAETPVPRPAGMRDALAADAAQLAQAKATLDLRRTQSRQAFIESAKLEEAQVKDFDEAMVKMNDGLREVAEQLADVLEAGEEPSRHEMMVFAAEALDVFIETDSQLNDLLTDDQYNSVKEDALDPVNYIDPALLDIFMGLQQ